MKRRKIKNTVSDRAIRNCESKAWFKSEKEAIEASEMRMLDNMTVNLAVYQCNICRNWHLTRTDNLI